MKAKIDKLKIRIPVSRPDTRNHASVWGYFSTSPLAGSTVFWTTIECNGSKATVRDSLPHDMNKVQTVTHMYKTMYHYAECIGHALDEMAGILRNWGTKIDLARVRLTPDGRVTYVGKHFQTLEIKINFSLDKHKKCDRVGTNNKTKELVL